MSLEYQEAKQAYEEMCAAISATAGPATLGRMESSAQMIINRFNKDEAGKSFLAYLFIKLAMGISNDFRDTLKHATPPSVK